MCATDRDLQRRLRGFQKVTGSHPEDLLGLGGFRGRGGPGSCWTQDLHQQVELHQEVDQREGHAME
jgi:hypothetical protein